MTLEDWLKTYNNAKYRCSKKDYQRVKVVLAGHKWAKDDPVAEYDPWNRKEGHTGDLFLFFNKFDRLTCIFANHLEALTRDPITSSQTEWADYFPMSVQDMLRLSRTKTTPMEF